MAAYALAGAPRDATIERRGTQFLMGLGDFLLHWLIWLLRPLEAAALRLGLSPDFFNFVGLGMGAVSGLLIAGGRLELGGWAIAVGGIGDIMDGRIARARKVMSPYGSFIDSTLDRFVEVFVLLGLIYYVRGILLGPFTGAAAIGGALLVSYTRARGESLSVLCKKGLMRRGERMVLLFLICMLDKPLDARLLWPPGLAAVWGMALIAAGSFFTACQRTIWIARRLRQRSVKSPSPAPVNGDRDMP
jgi:CDP-diacylglycerol---glycerol-3-phosphate 3-phosphatidyltransferase